MKRLVKVLAKKDEKIIIIEQFRKQINKTTIELPGGNVESRETVTEAAKRELREETGIVSNAFINLGTYIDDTGTIEVNLFFTNSIEKIENQNLDRDESINVQSHPLHLVYQKLFTGEWNDIRLGMALLIAKEKGLL